MNDLLMGPSISLKDIGRDLQKLSRENKKLERFDKMINGSSDTEEFRMKVRSEVHSTTTLVKRLLASIQELKSSDSAPSAIKLQRLEQQFLTQYTKLSALTKSIKLKLEDPSASATRQKPQRQSHAQPTNGYDLSNVRMGDSGMIEYENHPAIPMEEDEAPLEQSQAFIPQFDGHLEELEQREEAIHQMVDDLGELHGMHQDLHALVYEQGEQIEVLSSNVQDAKENVQSGVVHLDKAASHQRSYRKKMCIILMIVLAMAAVLTVAIYYTSGKTK